MRIAANGAAPLLYGLVALGSLSCPSGDRCGPTTVYDRTDNQLLVRHAVGDRFRVAMRWNDLSGATTWLVGHDERVVRSDGKANDPVTCDISPFIPVPEPSGASKFDFTTVHKGSTRITFLHSLGTQPTDAGWITWLQPGWDGGSRDDGDGGRIPNSDPLLDADGGVLDPNVVYLDLIVE